MTNNETITTIENEEIIDGGENQIEDLTKDVEIKIKDTIIYKGPYGGEGC